MKFAATCHICSRDVVAESRFMLEPNFAAHVAKCLAKAKRTAARAELEARQGRLF